MAHTVDGIQPWIAGAVHVAMSVGSALGVTCWTWCVAVLQGKPVEEVPTADGLTIRVINNVIKKCEVRLDALKS